MKFSSKDIFSRFFNTIFPSVCIGCKKTGSNLCGECFKGINQSVTQRCPICNTQNQNANVCSGCLPFSYLDNLQTSCDFHETPLLRKAIHKFKYEGCTDLAQGLAKLFPSCLNSHLCPIPLHKKRFKYRGYNQAELLAQELSKITRLPLVNCLKRVKFSKPQMELSRDERLKNMQNAFAAITPVPEVITLVDDVATTLATLQSAAKTLKENGAEKVYGIVLSRVN